LTLALANATSNVLNQVWDTVEDRNNPVKCHRPVASGEISEREAMGLAFFGMLMMILMAGFVNTTFTILVVLIMLFSFIYSVPPLRTKKRLWWNNITIAIPRGLVGVLASVSIVCNPFIPDFIAVGVIISMYTFAVNPTKDISDIEGDKVAGVRNFCTVYGVKKAMYISAFFLILTYVVTVLFVYFGIITNGWLFVLMLLPVGIAILYLMLFNPEKKFKGENTALWYLFYIQMIIIVVSFVATTIA
jgi:4-hydroxybenzoate polyprenyltransferase